MGQPNTNLLRHHPASISFVIFVLLGLYFPCEGTIEINDYGIRPVNYDDTAIVFFATATHTGNESDIPIAARLKMESCCLDLPDKTIECNAMRLISGLGQVIHPQDRRVLKMYFVNYDLYGRSGTCVLSVMTMPKSFHQSEDSEQHWEKGREITIPFKNGFVHDVYEKLKVAVGWTKKEYTVCNSANELEAQKCANQQCLFRFNGARSFYNKKSGLCEPTPDCGDTGETILSPMTGKCEARQDVQQLASFSRDMILVQETKNSVKDSAPNSEEEKMLLAKGAGPNSNNSTGYGHRSFHNIECKHGDQTVGTDGFPNCTCHHGWRSISAEEWEKKGGSMDDETVVAMCDIPLTDLKDQGLVILVFLILAMLTPVAALIFCINRKGKEDVGMKMIEPSAKGDEPSEDEGGDPSLSKGLLKRQSDEVDADAVISEIANRREPTPRAHSSVKATDLSSFQLSPPNVSKSASADKTEDGTLSKAYNSPSTDELLTMKEGEKRRAHVPLSHVSSNISIPKVRPVPAVQASGNMNRMSFTPTEASNADGTLSTEEMTKLKKEKWAQYLDDGHQNGSVSSGAIKVQSMPSMKISAELQSSPEAGKKTSVNSMFSERLASIPEAYNLLSSLSNPRLVSTSESGTSSNFKDLFNNNMKAGGAPSTQSLWSNVASENATEPELEIASNTSSYSDVRVKSLYGIMEPDEDSDGALERMAGFEKVKKKEKIITSAELFEYNQKLFGFPQSKDAHLNNNGERYISSFGTEFDRVPSEAFPSSDSDSTTISKSPERSGLNCWRQNEVTRTRSPAESTTEAEAKWTQHFSNKVSSCISLNVDGIGASGQVSDANLTSPETRSAYQIKSSLSNSLKASRSKSDASIFPV